MHRTKSYRKQNDEESVEPSVRNAGQDAARTPNANAGHRFASVPVSIQARLEVGAVDDPLEGEADQIANSIMRHAAPTGTTQTASADTVPTADAEQSVRQATRGGGSPLDHDTANYMQEQFGHDFGNVRIHTNEEARTSAQEMKAEAYTYDNHIVFGEGHFAPQSESGRWLLAHELAHVVQQGAAAPLPHQEKE